MPLWFRIFLECAIWCAFFTLSVYITISGKRGVMGQLHNYPPKIIKRVKELGNYPKDYEAYGKKCKLIFMPLYIILLTVLVLFAGGARTFWSGFLHSYVIFFAWQWFDALVLDCLWFCHGKRWMIPGTEDMADEYHNYWFHIKWAVIGTPLAAVFSLIFGGIAALVGAVWL